MKVIYLFLVFLGFSKASSLDIIPRLDKENINEAIIRKFNLNEIKENLRTELKNVLSQFNVDQLKEKLAESNDESTGPIETIILQLLERLRDVMRNGTDSIPVLDPIRIERISLGDSNLPSSSYVTVNDLTIRDISTFEVERLQLSTVWFRPRLDFNFVIPAVSVNTSSYDLSLNVFGGNIFGKGDMHLAIEKPRIYGYFTLSLRITGDGIFLRIEECRIEVALETFRPMITGMFNDQLISDFLAAFLRNLVPELLKFFEEDITNTLSLIVRVVGNLILAELDIGSLLP